MQRWPYFQMWPHGTEDHINMARPRAALPEALNAVTVQALREVERAYIPELHKWQKRRQIKCGCTGADFDEPVLLSARLTMCIASRLATFTTSGRPLPQSGRRRSGARNWTRRRSSGS